MCTTHLHTYVIINMLKMKSKQSPPTLLQPQPTQMVSCEYAAHAHIFTYIEQRHVEQTMSERTE